MKPNCKRKALIVATIASTIESFLFPNIRVLQRLGYAVEVAANFEPSENEGVDVISFIDELADINVACNQIEFTRSAHDLARHAIAFRQIHELLDREQYEIVHTNTPIASAITRVACNSTNTCCIYTAHGFHFYDGAPLQSWLLWYPIEKQLSRYTDMLITINHEDYERAQKRLHAKNVICIPGVGIDLQSNAAKCVSREKKCEELGLSKDSFVFLSIGELNANKNHSNVIKALGQMRRRETIDNVEYLIAGNGSMHADLDELAQLEGVSDIVHLLGYRNDIDELLMASDVLIHPSFREGLPVSIMEAMAVGVPVAASSIRGCRDLIDEGKGGLLFEPNDIGGISAALDSLRNEGEDSLSEMGQYNKEKVKGFSADVVEHALFDMYTHI